MRNSPFKESRLWAITLFFSGILVAFQWAAAEMARRDIVSVASLTSSFSGFVYPNPVRVAQIPTLVVAPGTSEKISLRVVDASGAEIFHSRVDDHPLISADANLVYEVPLTLDFKPGVYTGLLLGYEGDRIQDRSMFRFSVVK